jgi:hypothetical protein
VKATQAQEVSRADDLLAQARALLLRADRARDLRTALLAVREARVHVELLSVIMRGLTTPAAVEPTQDAQEREEGV